MLKFAWPWMILLAPLPWVLLYLLKQAQRNRGGNAPVIAFPKLMQLSKAFTNNKATPHRMMRWQLIVASIAWLLLVACLMRPELVKDIAYSNTSGYDLLLAVDLSRSMDIVDFNDAGKPISRIAATKKVVSNFVRHRAGDRVGLIVFAEQAFMTIPLTMDTTAVSKLLDNLLVGMAGERTAIGDAIGIGVQNMRNRPLVSRVLILLTDGEDTASHIPPLEAAKIAASEQIKIYTIGVGDKLDDALLKKIAETTGGEFFKVVDVSSLAKVYQKIDQLEKSETQQQVVLIKTPLFQVFLVLALLCVLAIFMFNTQRFGLNHEFR